MFANLNLRDTVLVAGLICILPMSVYAQIETDGTTATTVTSDGNNFTIDNGDRVGGNLFHSFQDFSVPNGGQALFNNAVDVSNIFSRVTGGNLSNIDGLIGANGTANLFLINPAGILFGEGASLSIGGSFYGSTADSIVFPDGEFSATDLDNPPLLTINAPIGFNFRDNPADIQVNGAALRVLPGQTLALLGGDIDIDATQLFPAGVNLELGGLASSGTIGLDENFNLDFPEDINLANVSLTNGSIVFANSNGGGSIHVNAANLSLSEASRLATGISQNSTDINAQAGDITINATDTISLTGNSQIDNSIQPNGIGNAGNIELNATNILLSGNSRVESLAFANATGNTGDIILTATGNIQIIDSLLVNQILQNASANAGDITINANSLSIVSQETTDFIITSRILNNTLGQGNAGDITINVADNFLLDTGGIASQVSSIPGNEIAQGNAGTISINAGSAIFQNRSEVLSDTNGQGNAGNINFTIQENIFLDVNTLVASQIRPDSEGNAGAINIFVGETFSARNFSFVSTNVQEEGIGRGGNITLIAKDVILTEGSILDALTENVTTTNNDGGSINVQAQNLTLTAGGKIITGTDGNGNAGNIDLQITGNLEIDGANAPTLPPEFPPFEEQLVNDLETATGLFASATARSSGIGGSIIIMNPTNFTISNGGQVTVNGRGTGNGGSLFIQAQSLTLNSQSELLAATQFGQEDQELTTITLNIEDTLSLEGDSRISAQAFNNANGGNIFIDAEFVIALNSQNDGNDIIASAEQGNGGKITITATEILGFQEQPAIDGNQTNDIDASSDFGFDGDVSLNTPDIGAAKGVVQLSADVSLENNNFASVCQVERVANTSTFIIKGRGGIPPQPIETFTADNIILKEDYSSISRSNKKSDFSRDLQQKYPPITTNQGNVYPARGLVIQKNGNVLLTRYPRNIANQRVSDSAADCSSHAAIQN